MAYVNNYKPPVRPPVADVQDGPYDLNFMGQVPDKLETDRVRLVPFVPYLHAKIFHDRFKSQPEMEKYLPMEWLDYEKFLTSTEYFIRADPECVAFAVIDRTKGNDGDNLHESLAGMIGYLHYSPANLAVEIGPVITLPGFQRTFVTTHATGLVIKYALNLPSQGGMGLRRVSWTANPCNEGSVRAAQRMGLKIEGHLRWHWVLWPEGKDGGKQPVDGKRWENQGRDSTQLSICWDDWENGGREHIENMINRR